MSDEQKELLTHSAMRMAATCKRKYFLRYVCHIVSDADSLALRFGSAFHLGLEMLCQGSSLDEALDAIEAKGEVKEYDYARLFALLSCYVEYWKDAPLPVAYAEWSFYVPLRNPMTGYPSLSFESSGKIDLGLFGDMIGEHKTTSMPIDSGSDYWDRLRADQQLSQYMLAYHEHGRNCNGALYNVIRKPLHRPKRIPLLDDDGFKQVVDENNERVFLKTGKPRQSEDKAKGWLMLTEMETPEEFGMRLIEDINAEPDKYFARREVRRTHDELQAYAMERWVEGQALLFSRQMEKKVERPQDAWPRNIGITTCDLFKCPYRELCFTNRTIVPGEAPEGFVIRKPHKELEDE